MEFFTFSGRAGRLEYLGIVLVALVFHTINALVFIDLDAYDATGTVEANPLYFVGMILGTWVTWSAAIRRCHDLGRSGFFLLWGLVPLLGVLAMLYVVLGRGDDMKNRFGSPPWSITNRAEKRAELERAARQAATVQAVDVEKAWVDDSGAFDMDGLWNESNISR